jgi:hypothetical protein
MLGVFYVLSILTLVTYTLVVNYFTVQSLEGLINSLCIIATDVIILILILITSKSTINPIFNSFAAIFVRICIIGFTGKYWFLGYSLLYLILMIFVASLIVNKHFPSF